jgi:hypothetical protein
MTNPMHPEELISASLTGDLTDAERVDLDRHLAGCARCRDLLGSMTADRQLLAGLRRESAPRDLGARVRTGVPSSRTARPAWWRPSSILAGALSIVAVGALAGIAVANGWLGPREVAQSSTPVPSPSVVASALPSESGEASPSASPTPSPSPTPPPLAGTIGHGYINYLEMTGTGFDTELGTYDAERERSETQASSFGDASGPAVVISLSPDYRWMVYQTQVGQKGTNAVWAYNLRDAETIRLGETEASAFGRRMSWSADSRFLGFTLVDVDHADGPDAAIFDTEHEALSDGDAANDADAVRVLTNTDDVYAASFDGERLWISRAASSPVSYLVPLDADLSDLDSAAIASAPDVFLPLLSPNAERVIVWSGGMQPAAPGWTIATAGMLSVADYDGTIDLGESRPLFADLEPLDQEGFASAQVSWSFDSDWFAVWDAQWQGLPHGTDTLPYPAADRVYVARASGDELLTATSSLGRMGLIVDVTYVDLQQSPFDSELPTIAVTLQLNAGSEGGASAPTSKVTLYPAGGSDGPFPEIGDGTTWVGPVFYVAQGNE